MRGLVLLSCAVMSGATYNVDRKTAKDKFWGIGALSAGASSRLLIDYPEPQRSQVLDYLFKPNFGASLHMLKVEMGGDSQSTDGTETSHMHSRDDLDVTRGYEWWLMKEAKKRNPDIKLAGLPWAFPGWVGTDPVTGQPSTSPFTYPNQTALYVTNWVKGAKQVHGLDIDYLGVWNERASSATYVRSLKRTLTDAGFGDIKLVAKDGGAGICNDLSNDPAYAADVDIIGLHYPSDYQDYSLCHSLNKPIWASEESSSYDDFNGAACWARVTNSHYVLAKITSSIMWALVGSYYHGTNWYASSLFTAVEPWSGNVNTLEAMWATAHLTQFTKFGWKYLPVGSGSGQLDQGGFYNTLVDPNGTDFTILIVKISHDHAECTRPSLPGYSVSNETAVFQLSEDMINSGSLVVWRSNYETNRTQQFERQADLVIPADGRIQVHVGVGDYITLSTVRTAKKGHYSFPASNPHFPLPHHDNFNNVTDGQEGRYLSDQIGAFEVHGGVLRQMVPQLPIGWSDHGTNGPVTLLGMKEYQDVAVQVATRVPTPTAGSCVATRVNQKWAQGVVLCMLGSGDWNLTYGGPPQSGTGSQQTFLLNGHVSGVVPGQWFTLRLETVGNTSRGICNGQVLFQGFGIRNYDNGFAALGANTWVAVEYDDLVVEALGDNWNPSSSCPSAKVGTELKVRDCVSNGMSTDDQRFELLSSWQLRHIPSGLCAEAAATSTQVTLHPCKADNVYQQFKNSYTRIRSEVTSMYLDNIPETHLFGSLDGTVTARNSTSPGTGEWYQWTFYPNTFQLRNQYDAKDKLGYPKCLATCS